MEKIADHNAGVNDGGGVLGLKQILLAAVIGLLAIAVAGGFFDPQSINDCTDFVFHPSQNLSKNSHSQITAIQLPDQIRSLQIRMTATSEESDFNAQLSSGAFHFTLNPVGYAGLASLRDFAPFPHVSRSANLISIVFDNQREVSEIWLNRELYWEGSVVTEDALTFTVQTFQSPIIFDLATCTLVDG